ncbi:MAG: hypothetical protein KBD01_14805 [Acidobacteria bacterium]|nr:hypothetical protein [Acidobacteriota bacterium]
MTFRRAGAVLCASALAVSAGLAAQPAVPQAPPPAPVPATAEGPRPQAVVEAVELDVGNVPEGQEVTGTFIIRNTGQGELRLLQVKPG